MTGSVASPIAVGDLTSGNAATLSGTGTISGAVTVNGPPSPAVGNNLGGTIVGASGSTLSFSGGLTFQAGSASSFTLGTPNTTSGPALIATTGGTSGSLVIAGASVVSFSFSTPQTGTYDLFSYTGAPPNSGLLTLNPASITANSSLNFNYQLIENSGQNQIDLIVTGPPVFWTGNSTSWDTSNGTTAWVNGSGVGSSYGNGGSVTFADSFPTLGGGPNTTVTNSSGNVAVVIQAGGVTPATVAFTNSALNYTFSDADGTHGIAGSAVVSLSGTGTVTFTSPNGFTGPIAINSGQLNLQNSTALGTSSGVAVSSAPLCNCKTDISIGSIPLTIGGGWPGRARRPPPARCKASAAPIAMPARSASAPAERRLRRRPIPLATV